MDTTLSCAASVGDVYPHRTRHADAEGHRQLLDSPTSSSKSSLDMDERADPDDVLDALGSKNVYIWFLLISCSLVWGVGAPPMMSSAFITDSDTSHCVDVSNVSDCQPTVSLRSEFKLFGENSSLADWTTSAFMIGNMIGGSALSHMADRIGRRPAVVLSTIGLGVVGCLSALSPNVYVFSVMRCFQGAFFTGSSLIGWVLAYECIPRPLRAYTTILFGSTWVIGYCALAPFAYAIHTWRWLMVVSSIPALIVGIFFIFALPESFHFLVSKSDLEKTAKWMKKAEKYGKAKMPYSAEKLIADMEIARKRHLAEDDQKVSVVGELLDRKIFLLYTFVLAYLWSCDTFVYYGLSLFSTRLAGNRYVNYMLSGLVELPAYGIAPILLDKCGRKPSVSVGHFLTGVAMITYLFVPADELALSLTVWLIAKFAISCSFVNIFVYGSEIFPTTIRNLCIGICAVVSKIGGNLAPHVRALEVIFPSLPTIFFAGLAILAGALTLLLPETRNRPLPASVRDADRLKK